MFRKMRRFKQQMSDAECIEILKSEKRGAFAVHGEEGYPYAVPVNFYYNEEDGKLYFHGARAGERLDCIRANNKICFTTWDQGYIEEGDWAYNVKSVVVRGTAELIGDEDPLKLEILGKLGRKYYPTVELVEETISSSASRVQMVAVTIDHMTGKHVHEE